MSYMSFTHKPKPRTKQETETQNCQDCKHAKIGLLVEPCRTCLKLSRLGLMTFNKWERTEE